MSGRVSCWWDAIALLECRGLNNFGCMSDWLAGLVWRWTMPAAFKFDRCPPANLVQCHVKLATQPGQSLFLSHQWSLSPFPSRWPRTVGLHSWRHWSVGPTPSHRHPWFLHAGWRAQDDDAEQDPTKSTVPAGSSPTSRQWRVCTVQLTPVQSKIQSNR